MAQTTITEALQEIKTIGSRLTKKRESILNYIARDARIRDPFEKDGGSEKFILEERQALSDLESRVVAIRTAIQKSNLNSMITVGAQAKSVAEWLTWRREIAAGQKQFVTHLATALVNIRQDIQKKGGRIVAAAVAVTEVAGPSDPVNIVVNLDERKLLQEQEAIEEILGTLDGKLSLFNATSTIDV